MSLSTNPNVEIEAAKQMSATKRASVQNLVNQIKEDSKSLKSKFSAGDIDAVTYKNKLVKNTELLIKVMEDYLDKDIIISKRSDGIDVKVISRVET